MEKWEAVDSGVRGYGVLSNLTLNEAKRHGLEMSVQYMKRCGADYKKILDELFMTTEGEEIPEQVIRDVAGGNYLIDNKIMVMQSGIKFKWKKDFNRYESNALDDSGYFARFIITKDHDTGRFFLRIHKENCGYTYPAWGWKVYGQKGCKTMKEIIEWLSDYDVVHATTWYINDLYN